MAVEGKSINEDLHIGNGQVTWREFRKVIDDFLERHDLDDDVCIDYIDTSYTDEVRIHYADGYISISG